MKKDNMNPKVDEYINHAYRWQDEMKALRKITLESGLTEVIKWGKPCYTYQNKNIVLIQGFKEYCALLFFKGYQLEDPDNMLVKTGKNTVIGRQIRFIHLEDIIKNESILKKYIRAAIMLEEQN